MVFLFFIAPITLLIGLHYVFSSESLKTQVISIVLVAVSSASLVNFYGKCRNAMASLGGKGGSGQNDYGEIVLGAGVCSFFLCIAFIALKPHNSDDDDS